MESSSVWYRLYRYITDKMGYNVVLSNPWATKIIAASKKKTDKRDAVTLADLLRCRYISLCHVLNKDIIEQRQLVRYRDSFVKTRTTLKKTKYMEFCTGRDKDLWSNIYACIQ